MTPLRRKTLLAANIMIPGLIVLGYNCPLNYQQTGKTGTGFSCDVTSGVGTKMTWALYWDTQYRYIGATDTQRDCSGNLVFEDVQDVDWVTSMAAFQDAGISTTSFAQSHVYGSNGGWAKATVLGL
jgi:hypothetical protein